MAVVIRMKRTGRRKRPCYRISVADSRLPRDGRSLATLGVYDPIAPTDELRLSLNVDGAKEWLAKGALPSPTVRSIFKSQGVYEGAEPRKPRKRKGRYKPTATRKRRDERAKRIAERKAARRAAAS